MEVISVECIDTFDPKVVRITVSLNGFTYSFDIPSNIYPSVGGPLGWPTNPCS